MVAGTWTESVAMKTTKTSANLQDPKSQCTNTNSISSACMVVCRNGLIAGNLQDAAERTVHRHNSMMSNAVSMVVPQVHCKMTQFDQRDPKGSGRDIAEKALHCHATGVSMTS